MLNKVKFKKLIVVFKKTKKMLFSKKFISLLFSIFTLILIISVHKIYALSVNKIGNLNTPRVCSNVLNDGAIVLDNEKGINFFVISGGYNDNKTMLIKNNEIYNFENNRIIEAPKSHFLKYANGAKINNYMIQKNPHLQIYKDLLLVSSDYSFQALNIKNQKVIQTFNKKVKYNSIFLGYINKVTRFDTEIISIGILPNGLNTIEIIDTITYTHKRFVNIPKKIQTFKFIDAFYTLSREELIVLFSDKSKIYVCSLKYGDKKIRTLGSFEPPSFFSSYSLAQTPGGALYILGFGGLKPLTRRDNIPFECGNTIPKNSKVTSEIYAVNVRRK